MKKKFQEKEAINRNFLVKKLAWLDFKVEKKYAVIVTGAQNKRGREKISQECVSVCVWGMDTVCEHCFWPC